MKNGRRDYGIEVGHVIGRGTVVAVEVRVGNNWGATLRCECGNLYTVKYGSLVVRSNGVVNTKSCGCAKRRAALAALELTRGTPRPGKRTHGLSGHVLYPTWANILQRCENPQFHKYPRYGGRGIRVCERWHDVRLFIQDIDTELGERPPGCTLDRIDNDGDYQPGNVKWSTARQQARNKPKQGSSQFPGVHWEAKKQVWLSRVHLGTFATEEEAAAVYDRAIAVLTREGLLS